MSGPVILDISRLMTRAGRPSPTGIDRVELAYAKWLMETEGKALRFTVMSWAGWIRFLPRKLCVDFLEALDRVWSGEPRPAGTGDPHRLALALWVWSLGGDALGEIPRATEGRPIYVLVSHHHLDRPEPIRRFLDRTHARFACFVHDLIPIQWSEFAGDGQEAAHRARMQTVVEMADLIIANSQSTADALAPYLDRVPRARQVVAAPLGVPCDCSNFAVEPHGSAPYFLYVATIEPKKNHLLLLNIWRRFADTLGPAAPKLTLVGQRGWSNDGVVAMLERSRPLQGLVAERGGVTDAELHRLMAGASASLFPSFAEGFGLPVAESLAHGVPVLCSDLPVLRDVGGDAPEYLDPLDALNWMQAILDYAQPGSARRTAQLERLQRWRAPTWDAHFARVAQALAA